MPMRSAPLIRVTSAVRRCPSSSAAAEPAGTARPPVLRRLLILVSTIVLTAFAAREMYLVLQVAGVTLLEQLVLGLFVVLFAWVAF